MEQIDQDILKIFEKTRKEGSSSVCKDGLESLFRAWFDEKDMIAFDKALQTFMVPGNGGVDYERFLTWVYGKDQWNGESTQEISIQKKLPPILAPELEELLMTELPLEVNRPPVVLASESLAANRWKPRKKVETPKSIPRLFSFTRAPMAAPEKEPTITGRDIAPAPPFSEIVSARADDFKYFIEKDHSIGSVLQHFTDMLSADIFGFPFSVCVAIPTIEDTPLIAVSDGFTRLTGYTQEEIVGRNCRFLLEGVPQKNVQNQTRIEARRYCRAATLRGLTKLSHTFLLQRNARKNGELFWNLFMLCWLTGPDQTSFIVGLQLDLGPELNLAQGTDIGSVVDCHAENLKFVRALIFGQMLGLQIDDLASGQRLGHHYKDMASEMGLFDDIKNWVREAEASGAQFQEGGALPLVAWPHTSKYAVVNGGSTLLRLEADEAPRGGAAMTVLPTTRTGKGCSFKVRIDEVCQIEGNISKGAWLPCAGFTQISPINMENIGGLPPLLEHTAHSVCFRGDGCVLQNTSSEHARKGFASVTEIASGQPYASHVLRAGDTLEFSWRTGLVQVEVKTDIGSKLVYRIMDKAIPEPPTTPLYGLVDCCHAVCKMTLVV